MLKFDNEKSQQLDEKIITTLSSMLESQKNTRQRINKQEFLVKERKILYDLIVRINEERRVKFSF